ncbi:MAG: hypothetical protein DRI32_03155 [Chloroflexi bacterium]|nr:MAG: hypothetical protein DRI32_03155 [Chloroflexota bacterium]
MQSKKLWWISLYAISMAYLESAVVVYLRRLYGISDLMIHVPPFDAQLAVVELGRELATLVMLLAVGWVAGKNLKTRLSFAFFTFGLWDIFYYIWLYLLIQWPKSLLDTDLLFLIPLPWWGPVISPMLIALLMMIGGVLVIVADDHGREIKWTLVDWAALTVGILLMLYVFMEDALGILPASPQMLSQVQLTHFNWLLYLPGLILASFAILRLKWPDLLTRK